MPLLTHQPLYEAKAIDASTIALRAQLPMVAPDAPKAWTHLAYEGEWKGHSDGNFKFTEKIFSQIIANFEAQKNPVPCTFEHPDKSFGVPILAGGWIHKLEIRRCDEHGKELWGFIEFTQDTASFVKEGKLKYCSVVVNFKAKDRKSGKLIGPYLGELGFTNTPFLDGQHQISLSYKQSNTIYQVRGKSLSMNTKELIEKAYTELGEDASAEHVAKFVDIERQKQSLMAPDPAFKETTSLESDESEGESGGDPVSQAVESLAKDAGFDMETVLKAMEKAHDELVAVLKSAVGEDATEDSEASQSTEDASTATASAASLADAKELSQATVAALKNQLSEKDNAVAKLSFEVAELKHQSMVRRVDDAVSTGTILEKDKEKMVKLGQKNPELLEEWLKEATANPAVPTENVYKASAKSNDASAVGLSDEQINVYMTYLRPYFDSDEECKKAAIKRIQERNSTN